LFVTQKTRFRERGQELSTSALRESRGEGSSCKKVEIPHPVATGATRMRTPRSSHLQAVQIRNTFLHHLQFHLDEVVLNATGLGCREDLLPVEGVLAYWHYLLCLR